MARIDPVPERLGESPTETHLRHVVNTLIAAHNQAVYLRQRHAQEPAQEPAPEQPILPSAEELNGVIVRSAGVRPAIAAAQVATIAAVCEWLIDRAKGDPHMFVLCNLLRADAQARLREARE